MTTLDLINKLTDITEIATYVRTYFCFTINYKYHGGFGHLKISFTVLNIMNCFIMEKSKIAEVTETNKLLVLSVQEVLTHFI